MTVPAWLSELDQVRYQLHLPGQPGTAGQWPQWLPDQVRESLQHKGFQHPWAHQQQAAELAHAGRHTVISTPTASGKSLAFLMPLLAATWGDEPTSPPPFPRVRPSAPALLRRPHTGLYLSPTKALAHDQLRAWQELELPSWRVTTLDGDSDRAERDWARNHSAVVLTNPDMLHRSILPSAERWSGLLKNLRYLVIDELHQLHGSFGVQVGLVLRRLLRLCESFGSSPVVIAASATLDAPAQALAQLIAADPDEIAVVDTDHSPHPELDLVIAQAEDRPDELAADISARLVAEDVQTCTFVSSRAAAEDLAARIQRATPRVRSADSHPAKDSREIPRAMAYRGGLLPLERRAVERALADRRLMSVASTSALELGVDIAGLDAVVVSGHPGSPASLWQRIGRAGRGDRAALGVLVAANNPLDAWWCDHPEELLSTRAEQLLTPTTGRALPLHLAAAAQEIPLQESDSRWFGEEMVPLADQLSAAGVLRRRPGGWFWTRPDRAVDLIDLRGGRGDFEIAHPGSGRVIGHLDAARLDAHAHPEAIYRHQGEAWRVVERDEDDRVVWVEPAPGGWNTRAVTELTVCPSPTAASSDAAELKVTETLAAQGNQPDHPEQDSSEGGSNRPPQRCGTVQVSSQVIAYLRVDEVTGTVWDRSSLDLPVRRFDAEGSWFEIGDEVADRLGWTRVRMKAAVHALEHALVALAPAVARIDPRELTGWHGHQVFAPPDAGGCWQVGVFERGDDAAGAAQTLARRWQDWLAAGVDRLETCGCTTGCPRCVLFPGCPDANQNLDRGGALELAQLLRAHR